MTFNSIISSKKKLIFFLNKKKFKRIFVLSGTKSYIFSGAKKTLDPILKKKETYYYYKKSSFPRFKELINIIKKIDKFNPDLFFAIGGGSVIDYAKLANTHVYSIKLKKNLINSKTKIKKKNYLLTVPTTAGSGAEVTSGAVIYINKIKYSVENKLLIPDKFFLISEFVSKLPKKNKASSGFDAIAQSIESLISIRSTNASVKFAIKSLKYTLSSFLDSLKHSNHNSIKKMCIGANLAGKAINISKTTASHAISYPFTSHFGINHGHAVSLTLNKFLKFNYLNANKSVCNFNLKTRYKIIFDTAGVKDINELDNFLTNIKKKGGLTELPKLKFDLKKEYPRIVKGVNEKRLSNNPIKLSKMDIKKILFNF